MKNKQTKILLVLLAISAAVLANLFWPGMKVESVNISIKKYDENDGGKFWKVCLNDEKRSKNCNGFVNFKIHAKGDKTHDFSIELNKFRSKCTEFNINNFAIKSGTSITTKTWLNNLNPNDIDYIYVSVRECSREDEYIYMERITPINYK